jgi:hypothetical protein
MPPTANSQYYDYVVASASDSTDSVLCGSSTMSTSPPRPRSEPPTELVCEHLQAVTDGQIKKLLVKGIRDFK